MLHTLVFILFVIQCTLFVHVEFKAKSAAANMPDTSSTAMTLYSTKRTMWGIKPSHNGVRVGSITFLYKITILVIIEC